eukprot:GILJ01007018.1.p1 GENE.GILJ01007018.1~~GILJ01007018.1.p1  ORF type:complete len:1055 (-),score=235.45 GILJ01007018.1:187-3351(-)
MADRQSNVPPAFPKSRTGSNISPAPASSHSRRLSVGGNDPKLKKISTPEGRQSPAPPSPRATSHTRTPSSPGNLENVSRSDMSPAPAGSPPLAQQRTAEFSSQPGGNVKVVCRFRPSNDLERSHGSTECVEFAPDHATVALKMSGESGSGVYRFTFDQAFDMNSTQADVFEYTARPIVEDVLQGFNGTVFAYGQTSSGKTHTMEGPDIDDEQMCGIIPRMVKFLFQGVANADEHIEFTMKVSIIEIYMERIRDLLDPSKDNLKVHEDKERGIWVGDATEEYVSDISEVFALMKEGASNRAIAATNMNEGSSRSHSIFMMTITQRNLHDMSVKVGKLYLVDLAGSEKIRKTGASGQTLDEAKTINKSLSALGNVINALTDGKSTHVPYRDSKLTRVLQESIGGNSRTTLIVTCSPSSFNDSETLSTLRFGQRAKSIKNKPRINQERSVAELKLLLGKAERTIEEQQKRILVLEQCVISLGGTVPAYGSLPTGLSSVAGGDFVRQPGDMAASLPVQPLTEKDEEGESEAANLRQLNLELNEEMEEKKRELKLQDDKISKLRMEIAKMKTKETAAAKENEILVQKMADMTLKMERVNYEKNEKADMVESLTAAKEGLQAEISVIRSNNEHMLNQLQQKEKELEREREERMKELSSTNNLLKSRSREQTVADTERLAALESEVSRLQAESKAREEVITRLTNQLSKTPVIPVTEANAQAESEPNRLATESSQAGDDERDFEQLMALVDSNANSQFDNSQLKRLLMKYRRSAEMQANQVTSESTMSALRDELDRKSKRTADLEKRLSEQERLIAGPSQVSPELSADRFRQLEIERQRWDREKSDLMRDLQNRVEKVVDLEMTLFEEKEKYSDLQATIKEGDRPLKKKVQNLERNMEQLTLMYHQLVSQNSALRVENQVNEKKISRKNERIQHLEKNLQTMRAQLDKAVKQTAAAESNLERIKTAIGPNAITNARLSIGSGRIVKPIRGGGGRRKGSMLDDGPDSEKTADEEEDDEEIRNKLSVLLDANLAAKSPKASSDVSSVTTSESVTTASPETSNP